MKVVRARDYVLSRLERGHYTFSLADAESVVGAGEKTRKALSRLAEQGWLFSPGKGFYVIIDPQHQGSGFLPVEWFIDDWMSFLGGHYYLGMLTAAMLHGASHQKPQQVQIVRDRVFEDIDEDPYHISFFYKKAIPGRLLQGKHARDDGLRHPALPESVSVAGPSRHGPAGTRREDQT